MIKQISSFLAKKAIKKYSQKHPAIDLMDKSLNLYELQENLVIYGIIFVILAVLFLVFFPAGIFLLTKIFVSSIGIMIFTTVIAFVASLFTVILFFVKITKNIAITIKKELIDMYMSTKNTYSKIK